jgi:hypothetical protein
MSIQAAQTRFASPTGVPMSVEDAIAASADGDTVELLPGNYVGAIVIKDRRLTLRGANPQPVFRGDGQAAKSPAFITVRGGDVVLENLQFRGARAVDGGGAGVRQEGGRLKISQCTFMDNEHGLLSINSDSAELQIERSVFGLAPKVVGGLYHLVNVGRIARLSITGSRFQQGFEGHLIRTHSAETFIGYNLIHDGQRGGASYEIDVANGGMATIIGNIIGQSAESQNRVILAYGSEGRRWEKNSLLLSHNTFINNGWSPAWFVRVFADRLPDTTELVAVNNLIVGSGIFWLGLSATTDGNRAALQSMLVDPSTNAFELAPGSMWRGAGVDPHQVAGRDLAPKGEFQPPVGIREISSTRSVWTPGAYQR